MMIKGDVNMKRHMEISLLQRPQTLHGFEVALLFGWPVLAAGGLAGWHQQQPGRNYTRQDATNSEAIMTLFANFARSGYVPLLRLYLVCCASSTFIIHLSIIRVSG